MPNTRSDFYKDIAVLAFPLKNENQTDEIVAHLDLNLVNPKLCSTMPLGRE